MKIDREEYLSNPNVIRIINLAKKRIEDYFKDFNNKCLKEIYALKDEINELKEKNKTLTNEKKDLKDKLKYQKVKYISPFKVDNVVEIKKEKKKIYMYDAETLKLIYIYDSKDEAAKDMDVPKQKISNACNNCLKIKGYYFKYQPLNLKIKK